VTLKIVSLTAVKAFLDIPSDEDQWDDLLDDQIIPQVSDRIERHLNRRLLDSGSDVTEYFDSDGALDTISLERYPINSITAVYESTDRSFSAGDALDSDEYVSYGNRGIIRLVDGRTFLSGIQTVRIDYQGGYTATLNVLDSPPDDLVYAASLQIGHVWQRRTSMGTTSQSVAGGQVLTFQSALNLLPEVKSALQNMRRIPL